VEEASLGLFRDRYRRTFSLVRPARRACSILLVLTALACGDYSVELPNEYELVRFNAFESGIVMPDGTLVVEPTIDEYAVVGDMVLGHAEIPRSLPNQEAPLRTVSGYFFLDTATGQLRDGLERTAWVSELEGKGITDLPELAAPSRFD
jgi:hypothetical protein